MMCKKSNIRFICLVDRVGSSRAPSKGSLSSGAMKMPPDDDTDSMAEYGEGEAGNCVRFRSVPCQAERDGEGDRFFTHEPLP